MEPSLYFLMAFHCHQPVGNFGFVFEEAFQKAYEPFLSVLERHPRVHVALHYSGSLLEWCAEQQPAFLQRIRALVERGQVEVLASGFYEPILCVIPERDQLGQIARMRETVRERFGMDATGLWLTERVWEPQLAATLAEAGIRYTMLDANQFQSARSFLPSELQVQDDQGWDLLGCYRTETGGQAVALFPASKRLRYWMPFQEVSKTIEFLRRLVREQPVALTFADDGEKFGLWPGTHRWVYEQGWLETFFGAVERESGWLKTITPSAYLERAGFQGNVALPCGSYEEMLEWSGGYFRNFFFKYPESNAMYQRMLEISRKLDVVSQELGGTGSQNALAAGTPQTPIHEEACARARRALYKAQCNDAYWHGVFGGLYLGNLRRSVYTHLILAERFLEQAGQRQEAIERVDLDGDGREEVILRGKVLQVVVDPDEGGAMTELDCLGQSVNLLDTLARRYEPYHEKLRARQPVGVGGEAPAPVSIHETVKAKEEGLAALLTYDDHRRTAFLDYGLTAMPTLQEIVRSAWGEHRLWSGGTWQLEAPIRRSHQDLLSVSLTRPLAGGALRKTLSLAPNSSQLGFRYEISDVDVPVIGLEFNVCVQDEQRRQPTWQEAVTRCEIRDVWTGITLTMTLDAPATLASFPIETVSESEGGLERTPQGLALVFLWPTQRARSWACSLTWVLSGC